VPPGAITGRFNCRNVQKRNERSAISYSATAALTDIYAVSDAEKKLRVADIVSVATTGDDAKWLKWLAG
jgi:hypothetical protein